MGYEEVVSLNAPPTVTPGTGKSCENPCKPLPYTQKNKTERGVIASYRGLETASVGHGHSAWGTTWPMSSRCQLLQRRDADETRTHDRPCEWRDVRGGANAGRVHEPGRLRRHRRDVVEATARPGHAAHHTRLDRPASSSLDFGADALAVFVRQLAPAAAPRQRRFIGGERVGGVLAHCHSAVPRSPSMRPRRAPMAPAIMGSRHPRQHDEQQTERHRQPEHLAGKGFGVHLRQAGLWPRRAHSAFVCCCRPRPWLRTRTGSGTRWRGRTGRSLPQARSRGAGCDWPAPPRIAQRAER